jgi:chromosome segregation ATPase
MRNSSEEVRDKYGRRVVVDGVPIKEKERPVEEINRTIEEAGERAAKAEARERELAEEVERLKAENKSMREALVAASEEVDVTGRK